MHMISARCRAVTVHGVGGIVTCWSLLSQLSSASVSCCFCCLQLNSLRSLYVICHHQPF